MWLGSRVCTKEKELSEVMKFVKNKLALAILAMCLLTPGKNKSASVGETLSSAAALTISGFLLIYLTEWYFSTRSTEEKSLKIAVQKSPHIPAHIKRKILDKTSAWGVNNKVYLKYALSLPWVNIKPKFVDYATAEATLNASHYGLDNAKKRILEYLVAYQSNPHAKGKVLCLIGAPGVGKTSLVKSIATALERPFALVSTASQDFALRGTDLSFVSAEPGGFTKALCQTKSQYPIILLDEIDKAQNNTQALLEALDPERNGTFQDAFLDFGVNLSNVLFIATANNLERIPQPVRDRMELIQLEAYSFEDKINIARNYFIPQLSMHANLSHECLEQISNCVPLITKLTSRTSDGNDGVRSLRHALDGLINKQIFHMTVYGKTLDLNPENIKEYIDPYYTQLRLSEPKDLRTYCNNALRKLDIPFETFLKIERTISGMSNFGAASTLVPTYIDWISKYPFATTMAPEVSLEKAAEDLNKTHYGLTGIKETILDYLAGYKASGRRTTKILCFAGAPGVGKTTFAESIAAALGRGFTKISFTPHTVLTGSSLGIASNPGELALSLINAGTSNPVILLDELEKAHPSMQKELLALLDPSQNSAIHDEYLGFGMNLSNVFFIASVNEVEALPTPLRDRMQIIELDPYSFEERVMIAKNKLVPDVTTLMNCPPEAVEKILSLVEPLAKKLMPFEAGVRALKRSLVIAAEKLARLQEQGIDPVATTLSAEDVIDPYFSSNHLSDPKSPYSYCNQIFRHAFIPPEIFNKIDRKIASMTVYKGADSMIPLYAETVIKYPFGKFTTTNPTLADAQAQLDKTHSGLKHVKNNILDYLAGYIASNQTSSKVLCLTGAPGVGKTTVAESIAAALGRKFSKISFGAIHTLASQATGNNDNLSGPGPIAKALMDAGCLNPVILLDEIDKTPAHLLAQLLEVLDPAQNKAFTDRYLGFEMDLSSVLFITTANDASQIAWPLTNRMQMVEMSPYSRAERIQIAREKLLPNVAATFNLPQNIITSIDALIEPLVEILVRGEYGVRNLNRALVIAAERYARKNLTTPENTALTVEEIITAINPELLQKEPALCKNPTVGKVNGMYANGSDGGGVHPKIISIIPDGRGKLLTPDKLHGKYAMSSYELVFSWVKTNAHKYGIPLAVFKENDFRISEAQFEETEGPSAGAAVATAFISALTNRTVRQDIAITGTINMLGEVGAVGGYRSKILGSASGGIKKFIVPECARPTIEALKDDFEGLDITYISHVDEAINLLLV